MEIKAKNIHKVFGSTTVLEDVNFSLEKGVKVGLVGLNGTGKSTLLKIIAGEIKPDGGEITRRKGVIVRYVPQDTSLATDESIIEYFHRVGGSAERASQLKYNTMPENRRRNERSFSARLGTIIRGFGMSSIEMDRGVNTLSSGQKSKIFMVGAILRNPDVLLLDEPTNNLDMPALMWLEEFLVKSTATCLVVSHDRRFLDRIVSKIFEINPQTRSLAIQKGSYSDYLERSHKERNRLLVEYKDQEEEIARLERSVKAKKMAAQQGAKFQGTDNDKYARGFKRDQAARSAKTAKAIEARINQISKIEKPISREMFRILLKSDKPKGSQDIILKNVMIGYPDSNFRVGPISLDILYSSRIAILGLNGSGKSTLLKAICGKLPVLEGKIQTGTALSIGNLMQEHDDIPRETSIRTFLSERGHLSKTEIFALAKKFGFTPVEIDRKIGELSPGGRSRLLFALFSALSVNVLLLDEPTNHLDIEALDALEEMVTHYHGTTILVSHDRYFLEKFRPTDTYVLAEGQLHRQKDLASYLVDLQHTAQRYFQK